MKRTLAAALVLLATATALAGAQSLKGSRVGLEFGNPAGVLIYRPGALDFKLGYNFAGDQYVHLSGDYRLINRYQLVDFLHFFLAAGGYGSFFFEDRGGDEGQIDIGAHIPLGLQAFLFDSTVEVFVEAAPTVRFFPTIDAFKSWHGYIGFTILIK